MTRLPRLLLLIALLTAASARVDAQTPAKPAAEPLFRTIAKLDAALFDAYNTCNLDAFASFFPENLEFYHDKDGVTLTRAALVAAIKNNICGKVQRHLVAGTLEVHEMKGVGALEIGVHEFSHPGRDNREPRGQGRFVMLWENKGGAWKITRVFSFDHHTVGK